MPPFNLQLKFDRVTDGVSASFRFVKRRTEEGVAGVNVVPVWLPWESPLVQDDFAWGYNGRQELLDYAKAAGVRMFGRKTDAKGKVEFSELRRGNYVFTYEMKGYHGILATNQTEFVLTDDYYLDAPREFEPVRLFPDD